jgi:hypothetical protein
MNDLQRYIRERAARDPEFARGYEEGFEAFKAGVLRREAKRRRRRRFRAGKPGTWGSSSKRRKK